MSFNDMYLDEWLIELSNQVIKCKDDVLLSDKSPKRNQQFWQIVKG